MSETGLENFDRTLHKTNDWLNDIGDAIGPDKQRQFHALRSVLWALRDRLMIEEAFHLASHLPTLVRGIFWEDYRPAGKPDVFRSREEFLQRVSGALEGAPPMDPEEAARAVFAAMDRHVSGGEMEQVIHLVPEEVRELFPQR
ncbi:hypothetical protein JSE7799_03545 [Jannaschia seosinensis]|uniref:DUF2267 domain-containing protein n=1 Tax=Jannaschia seosinensis TaxID=313367 RepID=A0A0M7BFE8_9RHOB|nr:DUF2267 domain-containing protein [Jannaschia seosinensis]CUH40808.1 hypothetical protein JSE7799_03545 [Jannaschia seosinensis]